MNGFPRSVEVAIIGAGPYGLSIAAYLAARKVSFRIFGKPMSVWAEQMPQGMHLKSEGFASSLYDPRGEFTLAEYCRRKGIPYADSGLPVPLEVFVAYGKEFQKRFAPGLEEKLVAEVKRSRDGFALKLEDGETLTAHKVVVAAGISHFANLPAELAQLGPQFVSHSSAHSALGGFGGKRVAVLGAGASAADIAALLHQAGAQTHLVVRAPAIRFHNPPPAHRSLRDRVLNPATGIGPGLRLWFYVHFPHLFRRLPESLRLRKVKETLGPAPGWFIKDHVVGKVPIHANARDLKAEVENGELVLRWTAGGQPESLRVDHLISATGYVPDIERLKFLSPELRASVTRTGASPVLSAHFESSVRGLYFVGVSAANTFGPMMRFAYGAGFTARRIAGRLARKALKVGRVNEARPEHVLEPATGDAE